MPSLQVEIYTPRTGPQDRYTVEARCTHGDTVITWSRACKHGCEADPFGGLGCHTSPPGYQCAIVHPSETLLTRACIQAHTYSVACSCPMYWWMLHGPHHHRVSTRPRINGKSGGHQLSAEDHERLHASIDAQRRG